MDSTKGIAYAESSSTLFGILRSLKDKLVKTISDIACALADLLDELRGSSAKIKEISREIARTNVLFAMQLNEFGEDLKLLHNYYTHIYIKTKGMVEFGISKDLIPYYGELIEKKDYLKAFKEIRSFLDILTRRIKEILDEVGEDILTQSEQLKDQIIKLIESNQKSNQQLKENITESIEMHAECMRNRFFRLTTLIPEIKTQIDIVVHNIGQLTKHKKELEHQLKDEPEAVEKTNVEWRNVAVVLKEMFDVFAHLEKEVIEKKIPWETQSSAVAEDM